MKLLLASDGPIGETKIPEQAFFEASPENRKHILFIPYAEESWDAWDKRAEEMKNLMQPYGIDIVSAHQLKDVIAELDKVDGIMVGGGNTYRLLDNLHKMGLFDAIKEKVKNGLPYAGVSAGANVVCPHIRTSNDMPEVWPSSPEGMRLVPFQLNVHYTEGPLYYKSGEEYIKSQGDVRENSLKGFKDDTMVGLWDRTGLQISDNKVEVLGGRSVKLKCAGQGNLVDITDGNALSTLMQRRNTGQTINKI